MNSNAHAILPAAISAEAPVRILLVDDDPHVLRAWGKALRLAGYQVETLTNPREAIALVERGLADLLVSDVRMPEMSGTALLQAVHAFDPDLPVILITGRPCLESATDAVTLGALRYLTKPTSIEVLVDAVGDAVDARKQAQRRREALRLLEKETEQEARRAALEQALSRALGTMYLMYQPIVSRERELVGYEALLRSDSTELPDPGALLGAAEKLGRLNELSRLVRAKAAAMATRLPDGISLFLNLHPHDLLDEALFDPNAALSRVARRVVLEITERASLDGDPLVTPRLARLRTLGFRIAVDDLGAGYASLSALALLQPEVVKIDMSLVRGVDRDATKLRLIRAIADACLQLRMSVVVEGVETDEEFETLLATKCDMLQGYHVGKPARVPSMLTDNW